MGSSKCGDNYGMLIDNLRPSFTFQIDSYLCIYLSFHVPFRCPSSFTTTLLAVFTPKPLVMWIFLGMLFSPIFFQGPEDMPFSTWSLLESIWLNITLLPVSCPGVEAFVEFSLVLKWLLTYLSSVTLLGFLESKSCVLFIICFPSLLFRVLHLFGTG